MKRTILPLLALVLAALPSSVEGAGRPNLVTTLTGTPNPVAVGSVYRVEARVTNSGTGNAFNASMGVLIGGSYAIRSSPAGSCRAARVGSQTLYYCLVNLRPGQTATIALDSVPGTVGDYTWYAYADSSNTIRESNELDNTATLVETAY